MAKFYLMGNTSDCQMFGGVILTQNKAIVIDGGTVDDTDQLVGFLKEHANSHVDAWFFTHPHYDHIGCFAKIHREKPGITVDQIYHHFPPAESLFPYSRTEEETRQYQEIPHWEKDYPVHTVSVGEVFTFDDVSVRVLRVFNPEITDGFVNNSSVVYRIESPKASILLLGDLDVSAENELMESCPLPLLQADYTQMSHHGQWGVSRSFYEYIHPKRCIWPAPDWLWDNDAGDGFDTGPFQTVRTREWMQVLGVTEHFVEKDGIQEIEF